MTHIPHSTHEDEGRFIVLISDLISKRHLPTSLVWESSVKDEKARLVRKKQGETEAQEAEQLARELGVWDEFYGGGKESERRSKGKGRSEKDEEDTSALQALILKKKKNMDNFFDSLAEKYSEPESKSRVRNGKNKKRRKATEEDDEPEPEPEQQSSKKTRGRVPAPPDIDDEEFEKLQQKLFADKSKTMDPSVPKVGRQRRARGAK